MKKVISLILALMLCFGVCGVAYAAEDDFVPSISYKPGPDIETGKDDAGRTTVGTIVDSEGNVIDYIYAEGENGEDVECLVITTIAEALEDVPTGIPEDAEELLEYVYEELLEDRMELPFEDPDDMAIIQLVDATFLCEGTTVGIDHEAMLEPEGVCLELTFDLGVGADVTVTVMCYVDGQWVEVPTVNNGDGTVTCLFEKICPIAFAVPTDSFVQTPPTGDNSAAELGLWIALLAVSSVALAALVIFRRKIVR